MTSPVRIQHGETYHIYNRGNNREDIFFEERTYSYFLQLYAKYAVPVADTYAYCLLPNHFHFLVRIKTEEEIQQTLRVSETPRVSGSLRVSLNPSQQLGNLFNAYAKAINNRYGRSGSLFQNPFGRVMVTSDAHFVHLVSYIHRNPERHGFVKDYRDWPHTSYRALLSNQPTRLRREEVLEWFGGAAAFQQFHMQPVSGMLLLELVPDEYD